MKKSLHLVLFAVIAFVLSSCGSIMGPNLTDQASIDKHLRPRLEKYVDAEASIVGIRLMTTGDFEKSMDLALVSLYEKDSEKLMDYTIQLTGNQEPRIKEATITTWKAKKEHGLKLADIDFSKIAHNVNTAAAMLAEEDMPFDGIAGYDIEVDYKTFVLRHKFTLESKEGTEMSTKGGRAALQTNYYELKFEVDEDGDIIYVE